MAFTGEGLVAFVKTKIGVPYVYGMKGQVMTLEKYKQLKKAYGANVWDSDVNKVGKVCCDCSGLISWYTGIQLGSSQYKEKAKDCNPIGTIKQAPIGALVWQKGHIGVYIGMENGIPYYIAEDGSAYGCRKNKISNAKFTHWLLMPNFTYSSNDNNNSNDNNSLMLGLSFLGTTTANLNVRKYANTNCDILGTIPTNCNVQVLNEYTKGWYTINFNGTIAYVSSDYVKLYVTTINVKTAIEKLNRYGCISTKDYWLQNYKNLRYLDNLIFSMSIKVKKKATSTQIKDWITALNVLVQKGIINSPEYWKANINKIPYLNNLIINVANALV